jgi:Glucanosyltransferase
MYAFASYDNLAGFFVGSEIIDSASTPTDFFSLNYYDWCRDEIYESSEYTNPQREASRYSVLVYFSKKGCNAGGPRIR